MVKFLKVLIDGTIKETEFKDFSELYKKCGFRKKEGFSVILTNKNIQICGRTEGKQNNKNKYDFPYNMEDYSIDAIYGACAIVKKDTNSNNYIDLDENMWNSLDIVKNNKTKDEHINNKINNYDDENNDEENNDDSDQNKDHNANDDGDDDNNEDDENNDDENNDDENEDDEYDDDDIDNLELKEEDYIYSSEDELILNNLK